MHCSPTLVVQRLFVYAGYYLSPKRLSGCTMQIFQKEGNNTIRDCVIYIAVNFAAPHHVYTAECVHICSTLKVDEMTRHTESKSFSTTGTSG